MTLRTGVYIVPTNRWYIERSVWLIAGIVLLTSTAMALLVNPLWILGVTAWWTSDTRPKRRLSRNGHTGISFGATYIFHSKSPSTAQKTGVDRNATIVGKITSTGHARQHDHSAGR